MLKRFMILTGCLTLSTTFAFWQTAAALQKNRPPRTPGNVGNYEPRQVLRKPIRPITDPAIVTAAESNVAPNELVIGVEVNGHARAYPINQLTGPQREIINDKLGGTAIAATW